MNWFLVAAGAVLLAVVLADLVATTLLPRGAGPLSGRLAGAVWRLLLALHGRGRAHRLLSYGGALILLLTFGIWTLLAWAGLSLLFLADPQGVVVASSGEPAAPWSRVYYAGYTLVTLGNGGFAPSGTGWQLLTVVGAGMGFFIFTLAVTYLLSVLSAVASKRQCADYLASLGHSPQGIVLRHWRDDDCSDLAAHASTLLTSVTTLSQQHLTYPVLHHFHASDRRHALVLQLAALDEALALIRHAIDGCEATRRQLESLHDAIGAFLAARPQPPEAAAGEPPPPSLAPLREAGVPLVAPERFAEALRRSADRRRRLRALVRSDGWRWDDVGAG